MEKTRRRDTFIDYLRGIGIILVVLGHAIQFGSGAAYSADGLFFENPVFRIIYSFHMPFFLLISGWLAWPSMNGRSFRQLARRKCGALFIPILVWGTIQFVIENALLHTVITPHIVLSWMRYCVMSNWFLWAVLLNTAVVGVVHYFLRDNLWIYAALLILSFVTPDDYNFHLYKFVFPFFLAAFLLAGKASSRTSSDHSPRHFSDHPSVSDAPHILSNKAKSTAGAAERRNVIGPNSGNQHKEQLSVRESPGKAALLLIVLTALYLLLLSFFHTDSYIYISRFSVLGKEHPWLQAGTDLYRGVLGGLGCAVCIGICRILFHLSGGITHPSLPLRFPAFLRRRIEELGRNSLGIYLLSGILFQYVIAKVWVNHAHSFLLNIVETLCMLIFCSLVTKLIAKSRVLSRILLGGR